MRTRRNKALAILLSLLMIIAIIPVGVVTAFAEDKDDNIAYSGKCIIDSDIKWTLDYDGVLTITGSGTIPDIWQWGIIGLELPDKLSSDLINSVMEIYGAIVATGTVASYVKDVESIVIGEGITSVGSSNFKYCTNAKSVIFPSTLTKINKEAFVSTKLKSVNITSGITSIGESAFKGLHMSEVTFDKNAKIKTLGKTVFSDNDFETITLPASLTGISADTFSGCTKLKEFKVADGSAAFSVKDGVLFNKDQTTLVSYPSAKDGTAYIAPTTVKTIAAGAFTSTTLKTITIYPSVTKIEDGAFNCPALAEIYNLSSLSLTLGAKTNGSIALYAKAIHKSLSETTSFWTSGDYEFVTTNGKTYLNKYNGTDKEIVLPSDLEVNGIEIPTYQISNDAFASKGLTKVVIPEDVSAIAKNAFANNTGLKTVTFVPGKYLTSIGEGAFSGCTALKNITLPSGIKTIGKNTFASCSELARAVIPATVETIGEGAFSKCAKLKTVIVESGSALKTIGKNAFLDNAALEKIDFSDILETIGETAFSGCSNLLEVKIPATTKTIGKKAFYNCESLEKVNIAAGSKLEAIADETFSGCISLETMIVPNSVKSIGTKAFNKCQSMSKVYICNKDCKVDYDKETFYSDTVICGYSCSNARTYALGHLRTFEKIDDVHLWTDATCTSPKTCYICGETEGEAAGHDYPETWTIEKEATCTESGMKTRTCKVCSNTESVVIPASGHSFGNWYYVSDPSNPNLSYKERICTVCGEKDIQKVAVIDKDTPPVEPDVNYVLGDVSGDGNINAYDARLALRFAAQLETYSYVELKAADVNGDGNVTALDARKILRVAAQLDKSF